MTEAINEIVGLLLLALTKGEYLRFPGRYYEKPDIGESVRLRCQRLDELGVPMWKQNLALAYINDVDQQPVWEELHRKQLSTIGQQIWERKL